MRRHRALARRLSQDLVELCFSLVLGGLYLHYLDGVLLGEALGDTGISWVLCIILRAYAGSRGTCSSDLTLSGIILQSSARYSPALGVLGPQ
jgi:hypothetical protein